MTQEKWLVNPGDTKTIDIGLVRKLKIGLIGGQVDVIGHDEPGVRVEVHSVSGKDLKISMDGDQLEIDHPQLRWDNFVDVFRSWNGKARADVSVAVPRDIALKFGVVSAEGLISGLTTDAKISTISGDITIDGLVGDLELNAVSGEISVRNHTGKLSAHSVSGDLMVTGDLHKFSADTVGGNMFLDITGVPDEINTNSVSGDLTVRLDEGVAARYRINSVSGKLQLDDTIIRGMTGRNFTHQSGPLDGSWIEVSANSVSGNISVVRRAASASSASTPSTSSATDGEASA